MDENEQVSVKDESLPLDILKCDMPFIVKRQANIKIPHYSRNGHWTKKEQEKYTIFLDFHRDSFIHKEQRRQLKIFKTMSDFIKTRNPDQCRSHHQKFEKYFSDTIDMIQNLWATCPQEVYDQLYQRYQKELIGQYHTIGDEEEWVKKFSSEQKQNYSSIKKKKKMKFIISYKKQSCPYEIGNIRQKNQSFTSNKNFKQKQIIEKEKKNENEKLKLKVKRKDKIKQQLGFTKTSTSYQLISLPQNPFDNQIIKNVKIQYNPFQQENQRSQVPLIVLNKRNQLINQCHGYWLRWIWSALELQQINNSYPNAFY